MKSVNGNGFHHGWVCRFVHALFLWYHCNTHNFNGNLLISTGESAIIYQKRYGCDILYPMYLRDHTRGVSRNDTQWAKPSTILLSSPGTSRIGSQSHWRNHGFSCFEITFVGLQLKGRKMYLTKSSRNTPLMGRKTICRFPGIVWHMLWAVDQTTSECRRSV